MWSRGALGGLAASVLWAAGAGCAFEGMAWPAFGLGLAGGLFLSAGAWRAARAEGETIGDLVRVGEGIRQEMAADRERDVIGGHRPTGGASPPPGPAPFGRSSAQPPRRPF